MTNKVAIALAVLIAGAFLSDMAFNDGQTSAFLARKFLDLISWVAFWR